MDWLKMLGFHSGSSTKECCPPEPESSESDLSTDEVINLRRRLKQKATEPIIPKDRKDKMEEEIREANEEFSDASKNVQTTLCDLNRELDARCAEEHDEEKKEEKAETRSTL